MKPCSPDDTDLVRGLRDADHAAFAQVYASYSQAVYNVCARILGDREEARDVTQEVFLTAFSRPPTVSDDVRLKAWLFRVATNACLNLKRGRRPARGSADVAAIPAAGDAYEQARSASLIELSLAEMNPRYRAALVLKDLQGLETTELASVMEVSRANADVLVHRARAAFRTVYTRLAGEGTVAPASLALVLVPLELPASLATLPPLAGTLTPLAPTPAGPGALGPAGVGLLAKLGAGLGIKAAIVAAGATVVIGGGIALHEKSDHGAIVASASAGEHAGTGHAGGHHGEGTSHDAGAEHRHLVAEHMQAGHHGGTHGATHETHHAGQAASHDPGHADSTSAGSSDVDHTGAAAAPSHHAGGEGDASRVSGGDHSDDGHTGGSGGGS
jgi:RNA polymerase sigma-70 factor (ECF subfamily)